MATHISMDLIAGQKVWSNFPVAFSLRYEDGSEQRYETMPLDMNAVYTFDSGLADGIVAIDELALWADSRRSMSVSNRLLNSIMTLIRKRRLSFYVTSQSEEWFDSRIRWQIDALCHCRDLCHRYKELEPGTCIAQSWRDLSGYFTGYRYAETGRTYERIFHGKKFWHIYDSWQEFDVVEAMRKVRMGTPTRVLEYTDGILPEADGVVTVDHLLAGLRQRWETAGREFIPVGDMRYELVQAGIYEDLRVVGRRFKVHGLKAGYQGHVRGYYLESS